MSTHASMITRAWRDKGEELNWQLKASIWNEHIPLLLPSSLAKASHIAIPNAFDLVCVGLLCAQGGADSEILQTRSHIYQAPFNCRCFLVS